MKLQVSLFILLAVFVGDLTYGYHLKLDKEHSSHDEETAVFEEAYEPEPLVRTRREPQFAPQNKPQQYGQNRGGGGSWSVGVNKDKGRGPQVRAEVEKNLHTSRNGNFRVDAGGNWEAGRGRKPDYGVGIKATGRFRREANPEPFQEGNRGGFPQGGQPQQQDRGTWSVDVNQNKGSGPQVRVDGTRNLHTSQDGNFRVDAGGSYEFGRGRKPDYNIGVTATGRFRREAEPFRGNNNGVGQKSGGGSWSVGVNKDKGRGPQVRAEGEKNIHTSKDGRTRVDAGGHWEAGRGRKPDHGVHIKASGSF